MLRAVVGLRLRIEGRAGPEGLGWKAEEFGLDAEGSGEPSKVLESLKDLARFLCLERSLTFSVWDVQMSQTGPCTIKKRPACLFPARL